MEVICNKPILIGDLVHISKDLEPSRAHFTSDCQAIVLGSYNFLCGPGSTNKFSVYIKGKGKISWYRGEQLELIERNRIDLLNLWVEEDKL